MEEARKKKRRPRRMPPWAGFLLTTILAIGIAVFIGTTRTFFVPSDSMVPTLVRGDQLWTDVHFAKQQLPHRGEIWVFNNPLPQEEEGSEPVYVKRVVGLPGDTVAVIKGRLMLNGKHVEEPYARELIIKDVKPVKLKTDELWVLGDNRNYSQDSSVWGPIHRSVLIGKVFARFWPLNRLRWF
jgi:signal peptidase I